MDLDISPWNKSWCRTHVSCKPLPFLLGQESQVFLALEQSSRARTLTEGDAAEGAASACGGRRAQEGSPMGCDCKNKVYKYKVQLFLLSSGRKLRQLLS